jgi:hypothetical protein
MPGARDCAPSGGRDVRTSRSLHPSQPPGILRSVADTDKPRRALTPDSRIALSKDQVSCDLAGEMAIVNLNNGVYYGLDPVGARVWNLLREPVTFEDLCGSLIHDYHVDAPRLEADMRTFLAELADQGLVDIT